MAQKQTNLELLTIGYEGLTQARLLELLKEADVKILVDVRELPLSRKPGFSKTALQTATEKEGITYTHLRVFGCPKPIRYAYRENGDWEQYTEQFLAYIDKLETAVDDLGQRAIEYRCCLLCFEADPLRCHRSLGCPARRRRSDRSGNSSPTYNGQMTADEVGLS